ncbi:flagellar hook assembly protein FlgD [Parvularcula sp. LCG005]|uniref:flagellar hook assembly protein FlgD n=1 Tax=Parvularcula sp. LCG005 TaxID=3078805 RepID=UPI002943DE70|nr:flagellar hook capping FlgD N-terminal domain-containing protein [Parvularcula sp. LCG005]WOI52686.1 flagellar hook capping FlgD N-terminal domain-containing protein [Parvularcula sp. LCG005]
MAEVAGINATAVAATKSATAANSLTADFDAFLNLLTAQVRNQDPLSPLDSTQFVEQLATFSGLEQQVTSNSHLEEITALLRGQFSSEAGMVLGETALSPVLTIENAFDALDVVAPGVESGRLVVTDADGEVVYQGIPANSWSWDGTDGTGAPLPAGSYKLSIQSGEELYPAYASGIVQQVISTTSGDRIAFAPGVTSGIFEIQ